MDRDYPMADCVIHRLNKLVCWPKKYQNGVCYFFLQEAQKPSKTGTNVQNGGREQTLLTSVWSSTTSKGHKRQVF